MDGEGTAILNDHALTFAQSGAGFKAQDSHREGAHEVMSQDSP